MRFNRAAVYARAVLVLGLALSLGQAFSPAAAVRDSRTYVRPGDFDFSTLLGEPPAPDSAEHHAEVARMLFLQNRRTAEDVTRCRYEADHAAEWEFTDVLGDDFTPITHPLTRALAQEVRDNGQPIIDAAKNRSKRPRPYQENPEIHPCVHLEGSSSYPSGHATWAMMWAVIYSDIFPTRKDALMARGRQIGDDRFLAGIHYPSDVEAGQKLGAEIARRLLANRDFQIELNSVRRECGQPVRHEVPVIDTDSPASAPATMP